MLLQRKSRLVPLLLLRAAAPGFAAAFANAPDKDTQDKVAVVQVPSHSLQWWLKNSYSQAMPKPLGMA